VQETDQLAVSEGGARLLGIRYADRADVLPIADCSDLRVMPTWRLDPLRGKGSVGIRSE